MTRIWTVPNVLSMIRILLIPIIVKLYLVGQLVPAGIMLVCSGLTDTIDGYIARHYNQITNLGKVLDPFADKLTQGITAIVVCLEHQYMIPLLVLLVVKEIGMGVAGLVLLKIKGRPFGAFWWGKISTIVLYVFMCFCILFDKNFTSKGMMYISLVPLAALGFSMIRYIHLYIRIFTKKEEI